MRRGFTMIELIFVIVIIGILAVIAIPKLNATRDDAKVVTELQNLSTCINDAGSSYTATGTLETNSTSCTALKCFTVTDAGNGTLTVANSDDSSTYCSDARTKANERKLVGDHKFGGSKIKP